jgi:hypothetical protein
MPIRRDDDSPADLRHVMRVARAGHGTILRIRHATSNLMLECFRHGVEPIHRLAPRMPKSFSGTEDQHIGRSRRHPTRAITAVCVRAVMRPRHHHGFEIVRLGLSGPSALPAEPQALGALQEFLYQAESWTRPDGSWPRSKHHQGELFRAGASS